MKNSFCTYRFEKNLEGKGFFLSTGGDKKGRKRAKNGRHRQKNEKRRGSTERTSFLIFEKKKKKVWKKDLTKRESCGIIYKSAWRDGWAGLRRTTGNRVCGNPVPRVRISLSPPQKEHPTQTRWVFFLRRTRLHDSSSASASLPEPAPRNRLNVCKEAQVWVQNLSPP